MHNIKRVLKMCLPAIVLLCGLSLLYLCVTGIISSIRDTQDTGSEMVQNGKYVGGALGFEVPAIVSISSFGVLVVSVYFLGLGEDKSKE